MAGKLIGLTPEDEKYLKKMIREIIGQGIVTSTREPHRYHPAKREFDAVTISADPFPDERYAIRAARPSNSLVVPDSNAKVTWEEIPNTPAYCATNEGEQGTHTLLVGTHVRVYVAYDKKDEPRFWFNTPKFNAKLWVEILGATPLSPNIWKYTAKGWRWDYSLDNWAETGITYTNIINSVEASNDGNGVEGHGTDVSQMAANFPNFATKPIRGFPLVELSLFNIAAPPPTNPLIDDRLHIFAGWNTDDGTC